MIGLLLNNPIVRWIGGVLAAALAILGYGAAKKRQGRQEARKQAEKADKDLAQRIRETADEIRDDRGGDALDRLRKSGRLRGE